MSEIIPEGAGNALTKKIGPLPGIAWVALIAGVVWLVYLWRKRGAAAGNSGTAVDPSFTPSAVGFSSAGPAPGTNNYSGTVSTTPVGQPATSTNAQWARAVTDFLVGTGNYSPSDVSNAISNFISGKALTAQQTAIVNTAVKQFQTPPEGVLPVNTGPTNYVGHKYTVQAGDTFESIMTRFYGTANNLTGRLISETNGWAVPWNDATGNWGAPAPGTVLVLPTNGVAGYQANTLNTYDSTPPDSVSRSDIGVPITIASPS